MNEVALQTKIEAAKSLHGYDHLLVSPEGVAHFAKIFGVEMKARRVVANPNAIKGLTLNDGSKVGEGMCAAEMAVTICRQLGVSCPEKFGRGSQLHAAAAALTKHFEAQL